MRLPLARFTAALILGIPISGQTFLTANLLDGATLRPQEREEMKRETARILLDAGVALDWVECEIGDQPVNVARCVEAPKGLRVTVQLVRGTNRKNPRATGIAIVDKSAAPFATVYVERVAELARDANWSFADLLGHAVAHELGHLLLGSSDHTAAGIMRARWETEDLRRLSHNGLVFLPGQLAASIARLAPKRAEDAGQR